MSHHTLPVKAMRISMRIGGFSVDFSSQLFCQEVEISPFNSCRSKIAADLKEFNGIDTYQLTEERCMVTTHCLSVTVSKYRCEIEIHNLLVVNQNLLFGRVSFGIDILVNPVLQRYRVSECRRCVPSQSLPSFSL